MLSVSGLDRKDGESIAASVSEILLSVTDSGATLCTGTEIVRKSDQMTRGRKIH